MYNGGMARQKKLYFRIKVKNTTKTGLPFWIYVRVSSRGKFNVLKRVATLARAEEILQRYAEAATHPHNL